MDSHCNRGVTRNQTLTLNTSDVLEGGGVIVCDEKRQLKSLSFSTSAKSLGAGRGHQTTFSNPLPSGSRNEGYYGGRSVTGAGAWRQVCH